MSFPSDTDRQRAHVMRAVRQAGTSWAEAMQAHKLAPPDIDFAQPAAVARRRRRERAGRVGARARGRSAVAAGSRGGAGRASV